MLVRHVDGKSASSALVQYRQLLTGFVVSCFIQSR